MIADKAAPLEKSVANITKEFKEKIAKLPDNADPEETRDVSTVPGNLTVLAEMKQRLQSLPPWPKGDVR